MAKSFVLTDVGGIHYLLLDGYFIPVTEADLSTDDVVCYGGIAAALEAVRFQRQHGRSLRIQVVDIDREGAAPSPVNAN